MTGKTSRPMLQAIEKVLAGTTPYRAAKETGITLTTMYKSRLYKLWRNGNTRELRMEIDKEAAR